MLKIFSLEMATLSETTIFFSEKSLGAHSAESYAYEVFIAVPFSLVMSTLSSAYGDVIFNNTGEKAERNEAKTTMEDVVKLLKIIQHQFAQVCLGKFEAKTSSHAQLVVKMSRLGIENRQQNFKRNYSIVIYRRATMTSIAIKLINSLSCMFPSIPPKWNGSWNVQALLWHHRRLFEKFSPRLPCKWLHMNRNFRVVKPLIDLTQWRREIERFISELHRRIRAKTNAEMNELCASVGIEGT